MSIFKPNKKSSIEKITSKTTTKKKTATRTNKYDKAEQLRKKLVKSMNTERKIVNEWVKSPTDDNYAVISSNAAKKSDADYKKYYDHVHGNFNNKQITDAGAFKGKFINSSFTKALRPKTKTKSIRGKK